MPDATFLHIQSRDGASPRVLELDGPVDPHRPRRSVRGPAGRTLAGRGPVPAAAAGGLLARPAGRPVRSNLPRWQAVEKSRPLPLGVPLRVGDTWLTLRWAGGAATPPHCAFETPVPADPEIVLGTNVPPAEPCVLSDRPYGDPTRSPAPRRPGPGWTPSASGSHAGSRAWRAASDRSATGRRNCAGSPAGGQPARSSGAVPGPLRPAILRPANHHRPGNPSHPYRGRPRPRGPVPRRRTRRVRVRSPSHPKDRRPPLSSRFRRPPSSRNRPRNRPRPRTSGLERTREFARSPNRRQRAPRACSRLNRNPITRPVQKTLRSELSPLTGTEGARLPPSHPGRRLGQSPPSRDGRPESATSDDTPRPVRRPGRLPFRGRRPRMPLRLPCFRGPNHGRTVATSVLRPPEVRFPGSMVGTTTPDLPGFRRPPPNRAPTSRRCRACATSSPRIGPKHVLPHMLRRRYLGVAGPNQQSGSHRTSGGSPRVLAAPLAMVVFLTVGSTADLAVLGLVAGRPRGRPDFQSPARD